MAFADTGLLYRVIALAMKMSATVQNRLHEHHVQVSTDGLQKELIIPSKINGFGSSVNGGELLLLSLATCYCNDIYREAAKRNITIHGIDVKVSGSFEHEGKPGSDFSCQVQIDSPSPAEDIRELILHTDSVAEIQNTLRQGASVTLSM